MDKFQFHSIEIKTSHPRTTVCIDGEQLHCVQAVDYHVGIDSLPTVTVKLLARNITIDGKCVVKTNVE